MTARNQVLDTNVDPLDGRRQRRRQWQRIGVPIGCVALMAAAIFAIALYSDRANRSGVLALSDDMVTALESRVALAVSDYLGPAARAVRVAREITWNRDPEDRRLSSVTYGTLLLKEVPQVANLSFADADGNYLMVRRGPAGGTEIKVIDNDTGTRRVTWTYRNDEGQETGRRIDPADDFDPRQRPWYTGAVAATDLYWTPPYVFYTDRQPGITVALGSREADGRQRVYGVDITLAALANFLSTLTIGRTGRAVIVDDAGQLIAAAGARSKSSAGGQEASAARIDELGDPILIRAYDQYRIEGHAHRVLEIGDRRYITSATMLESTGRDWSVLVVVPEDEFTGFVAANQRRGLILSLGIIALALLLAVLLIRQGLRADRTVRLLLDRQGAISRQSTAFTSLAVDAGLFDPSRGEPPRALTQTLAQATEARRAGIWRLLGGDRILRCEDIFDRDTAGHVDGLELHRDELPQFFAHLLQAEEIDAPDAAGDRRTAEAHRLMLQPLGSSALLVAPVLCNRKVVGAIWLEDAPKSVQVKDFARAVANMVGLRMISGLQPGEADGRALVVSPVREPDAPIARIAELQSPVMNHDRTAADFYAGATIMVLQIVDPMDLALKLPDGNRTLADELARILQDVATRGSIPYLKITGQQAIAAAGLTASGTAPAATDIAEAALAARDRCAALFEESACARDFRVGIDCGAAFGSMVGDEPRVFNLWGDALRGAEAMATSALPGSIQVTEAAYLQLRQNFLLRPRGRFYLPRVGEARTFVLAGRL